MGPLGSDSEIAEFCRRQNVTIQAEVYRREGSLHLPNRPEALFAVYFPGRFQNLEVTFFFDLGGPCFVRVAIDVVVAAAPSGRFVRPVVDAALLKVVLSFRLVFTFLCEREMRILECDVARCRTTATYTSNRNRFVTAGHEMNADCGRSLFHRFANVHAWTDRQRIGFGLKGKWECRCGIFTR
jgi:hypothetical protein